MHNASGGALCAPIFCEVAQIPGCICVVRIITTAPLKLVHGGCLEGIPSEFVFFFAEFRKKTETTTTEIGKTHLFTFSLSACGSQPNR